MADETDRIVVISAGFGVWRGGKCLAFGRWSDITAVSMIERGAGAANGLSLALRDGSTLELRDDTAGWKGFLMGAQSRLPGVPTPEMWEAAVATTGDDARHMLFYQRRS